MDFGVAQLEDRMSITMDGDLVGTLAYMSPEQIGGRTVDSRSDVYSLALTLYEGFTRRNPQKGKKLQELLRDVSRPDIPPLEFQPPRPAPRRQRRAGQAMAQDRYARPDAATFGRLLTQAGKLIVRRSARQDPRHPCEGARRHPRVDRERLVFLGSVSPRGRSPCSPSCTCFRGRRSIRRTPSPSWS